MSSQPAGVMKAAEPVQRRGPVASIPTGPAGVVSGAPAPTAPGSPTSRVGGVTSAAAPRGAATAPPRGNAAGSVSIQRPSTTRAGVASPGVVTSGPGAAYPAPPLAGSIGATVTVKSVTHHQTPAIIYITMKGSEEIKRHTLRYKALFNGRPLYSGDGGQMFFSKGEHGFGKAWIWSKVKSTTDPVVLGSCPDDAFVPPPSGWLSEKGDIAVATYRPIDWVEGTETEVTRNRDRIAKLLVGLRKNATKGDFSITIRDVLLHISDVKKHLPELLREFPKIDKDGNGSITLEELEEYFCPTMKRNYDSKTLDEIFGHIISGRKEELPDWMPSDQLYLEDLARHYEYVNDEVPELIERFKDVDTTRTCAISRDEFNSFFGKPDIWLESALRDIIGLQALKEQIAKFYWSVRLDRLRRKNGLFVNNNEAMVLMFKGSPGTGKTTIGRLITGLLHRIEVIPQEKFVECQRDELVGDHIGATEKKTEEMIAKADGGVLFVDEAYRLNTDVFGVEAINCLMKAMTIKGKVIIVAGYPKQMDDFTTVNPGIKRRITYEFEFPDYNVDELADILLTQIKGRGFQVDQSVPARTLSTLIGQSTTQEQRTAFNGGVGEHITRHAIFHLNDREVPLIAGCDMGSEPTPSVVLQLEDLQYGCTKVPPPPPKESVDVYAPMARGTGTRNMVA